MSKELTLETVICEDLKALHSVAAGSEESKKITDELVKKYDALNKENQIKADFDLKDQTRSDNYELKSRELDIREAELAYANDREIRELHMRELELDAKQKEIKSANIQCAVNNGAKLACLAGTCWFAAKMAKWEVDHISNSKAFNFLMKGIKTF